MVVALKKLCSIGGVFLSGLINEGLFKVGVDQSIGHFQR
jgi:hypothetical protein